MRRLQTIGIATLVLAACVLGLLQTAEAQIVVGVEKLEGKKEGKVRSQIHKVLKKKKIKVVTFKEIDAKAQELGANLEVNEDRVKVARELGLNAFVSGSVDKKGRHWVATIVVTNGGDGSVIEEQAFKHPKYPRMLRVVGQQFWKKLGGAIKKGEVPAALAPEPLPPPPEEIAKTEAPDETITEPAEPDEPSTPSKHSPLEVSAGVVLLSRSYAYDNDQTQTLRPYDLGLAPAPGLTLDWYPMAHFQDGFAGNVGLTLSFYQAAGLTSETSDGGAFPTNATSVVGGLRVRFPIDTWQISSAVLYGYQDFSIEDDGSTPKPLIPSVTYNFVGLEVASLFELVDPLSLMADVSYRYVLSAGEIAEPRFFPNATAWGLSGFFGLGYDIIDAVQARAGVEYQRYAFDLQTKAGDPLQADGATDSYIAGTLMLTYKMGGAK